MPDCVFYNSINDQYIKMNVKEIGCESIDWI